MVFSSLLFLFIFLPLFLVIYHFIADRYKNGFILISSLIFYAWGEPSFVYIAIGAIYLDFYIVKWMYSNSNYKLALLWASIVLNVGLLLYFKYANFFIDNLNQLFESVGVNSVEWTHIVLPIGLSFFTFQKLSYSIDVYREVAKPLEKLKDYAVYILLFPQLIAGPIVRYNEIAIQLSDRNTRSYTDRLNGMYRFSIGLAKKVLIANVMGEKADLLFSFDPTDLNSSIVLVGMICYSFQIYFDFSGYSDMAIGLGRMMGFKFPENFNSPYISQNITEFWRRWHITLGTWMRDYLYIPLGGNQVNSKWRLYINLWLVFLISGLWHGASWNFVLWGAYHGFFLIADRLFLNSVTKYIGLAGRVILTFLIVLLGWVLFRAPTIESSLGMYQVLFSFNFEGISAFLDDKTLRVLIISAAFSFFALLAPLYQRYESYVESINPAMILSKNILSIVLLIISVASLTASDFNPFIYFRF